MDQKAVCVFLLMLGASHALQCYSGDFGSWRGPNFDAANAAKETCDEDQDICCM